MTTIDFYRHAESMMNLHPEFVNGQCNDIQLSEEGRRQARMLGDFISEKGYVYDRAYVSEAFRTWRTFVGAFGEELGLSVAVDSRLNECSQGEAEGMPRREVYTPEIIEQMNFLQQNFAMPGGESISDVATRMIRFVEDVSAQYRQERIVAITSGLAIRALVGTIMDYSYHWVHSTPVPNVSLTRIEIERGKPVLVEFATPTLR